MTAQTFEPSLMALLSAAESTHFWFQARNRVIAVALAGASFQALPRRVMEVGCGTGNVLGVLEAAYPGALLVGMDLFSEAIRFSHQRATCALVQGDLRSPPFRSAFDLVGVFDVLEHLPDDAAALSTLRRLLRPGGLLALTVPAGRGAWSDFDVVARHRRRYEAPELRDRLQLTGFTVDYLTHFMVALAPIVRVARPLARLGRREVPEEARAALLRRELSLNPVLNWMLARAVAWEPGAVARRYRLPLGTSLLALARNGPVP